MSTATSTSTPLDEFIRLMPKVELHLHLEGTLEADLLLALSKKNNVKIDFETVEQVKEAYSNFTCLDDFLKLYYQGMDVLLHESDFYDLAWAYLCRVHTENVRHVEVFYDPQPHMERGVAFDTFTKGFCRALKDAKTEFNMTSKLIMCFSRHFDMDSMFETLELSRPFKDDIAAVGLSSTELGNPPIKYKELFAKARDEFGYDCVAHAGEEGPPDYVTGALDDLQVKRVDHGVRSFEDPELVARLAKDRTPLTICPISNCKLCVFPAMKDHTLKKLLDQGVCVTINSDDPAYFGSYITENFMAIANEPSLEVERNAVIQLVQNSIEAALLTSDEKATLAKELEDFCSTHPAPTV
jgi:adenosine deaminase